MKQVQRVFYPGSKWLYIKIYTGIQTCDEIITNVLSPLSLLLMKKKIVSKWFFIRYSDCGFHLRYRLLLCDEKFIYLVLEQINKKLKKYIDNHLINKIELSTYERELERYGAHLMEETETHFCDNSELICALLQEKEKNDNENYRWMSAFLLIDTFLSSFDLSIVEKQQIIQNLNDSFCREFGFNEYNSKQINALYRIRRNAISTLLDKTLKDEKFCSIYKLIDASKKAYNKNLNKTSCMHMMLNRLFASQNRLHEMLIYNFLNRYYKSKIAIEKYKTT